MGRNLEFILQQQLCHEEYAHDLLEIYNYQSNQRERLRERLIGGQLSALLDCFNYGIIIGKRMERLKKRKNSL